MPSLNRPRHADGPALGCRVNATLTLVPATRCGGNQLAPAVYAYGGFHQYSDEVYGDLHRLTLDPLRWESVSAFGEPTAGNSTSDDGVSRGIGLGLPARYDHAAALWRERMLVVFGGHDEEGRYQADTLLSDVGQDAGAVRWHTLACHGQVPGGRAKHAVAIAGDIFYVSGGYVSAGDAGNAGLNGDLCRLDLRTGEWLKPVPFVTRYSHQLLVCTDGRLLAYGGYNAEVEPISELAFFDSSASEGEQVTYVQVRSEQAPDPSGQHFAGVYGDQLAVLVTRCLSYGHSDLFGLWSLDLRRLTWRRHAEADELAEQLAAGSWHYAVPSTSGDRWWLFGAAGDQDADEYLGAVVELDLREHGVIPMPASDIGQNLTTRLPDAQTTPASSFRVHRCILAARWPHFANMLASGAQEVRQGELCLPEPPGVVLSFLHYLYADALDASLPDCVVARLLVLANLYCMTRLQRLCCRRLHDVVSVANAAFLWEQAVTADERGLARRVMRFICEHFGAVCRTPGFRSVSSTMLAQFWEQMPEEARIVGE
ncbi:hypothetical protein THASP1DRAFT_19080 [Thamnocephalis sphaerospora]|uniref:BTB domain-containing protein n=1 Tax=Thamnocephalis sphaerospora TaxID=78915 RepID=A0A4P9XJM1_9FUNG|nr:hypothetical protein THASP1DRAFT_19080 [Thamnocephalis sphaerospora]|eukprot:RKP05968.1 hypothetical protein THASP1DRAFT_19080 [Thamnocephalis sphaerospora]